MSNDTHHLIVLLYLVLLTIWPTSPTLVFLPGAATKPTILVVWKKIVTSSLRMKNSFVVSI
jgi:uncharacterized integral membrane protein